MYPPLIIFRHGQTEWNREGIHQGQLDSPLTEMGRQQAAGLTALIRPLIEGGQWRAVTSPSGRAKSTAQIALTPLGIRATPDDRLLEVNFGAWQGFTSAEIFDHWPEIREPDPFLFNFAAPHGESLAQMRLRVQGFLDEMTGPTIVSTHGITSRVLRGLWLGLSAAGMRDIGGGQGCVFLLKDGKQQRFG